MGRPEGPLKEKMDCNEVKYFVCFGGTNQSPIRDCNFRSISPVIAERSVARRDPRRRPMVGQDVGSSQVRGQGRPTRRTGSHGRRGPYKSGWAFALAGHENSEAQLNLLANRILSSFQSNLEDRQNSGDRQHRSHRLISQGGRAIDFSALHASIPLVSLTKQVRLEVTSRSGRSQPPGRAPRPVAAVYAKLQSLVLCLEPARIHRPFAIRSACDSGQFLLIGKACVDGLMQGNSLTNARNSAGDDGHRMNLQQLGLRQN